MKQLLIRFRSGVLIYLAIALIAIGLGLLVSNLLCGSMLRQQEAAIHAHLHTEATEFKNNYQNLNTFMSLGYQKLRSQAIVSLDSADANRLSLYKARETLTEIYSGMSGEEFPPIQELMMYFTRSNLAVTTNTVYSLKNLAELYFHVEEAQLNGMLSDFMNSGLSQTIRMLESAAGNFCLYLRRFTVRGSKDCMIGISVLQNEMFLFDSIYQGNVYIATATGQSFDRNGLLLNWPDYNALAESSFRWRDKSGAEYQVFSEQITPGYRMGIVIPQTVYRRGIFWAGALTMLLMSIAGLALGLTLFHARRRYNRSMKQIGELLHLPSGASNRPMGEMAFEQICQSLTHLIHQNDHLLQQNMTIQKQVENSRVLMRNSFVLLLLQSRIKPEEMDSMLNFYNIRTDYERYRVLLLQIDGSGLSIEKADSTLQVLLAAVSSIMLDCAYETCAVDSHTVGLLYMCSKDRKCEMDNKVRTYALHLTSVMHERLGVRISVGLGRSVKDIHHCYLAYHSARIVLICSTRSTLKEMNLTDSLTEEDSRHLMDILRFLEAGDTQQCLKIFDTMFQQEDEDGNYAANQRTGAIVFFSLFDDTVNNNAQLKKLFAEDTLFNQQLSQCITLDEILKLIRIMLQRACAAIASSEENRSSLLINHAVQILQERFTDPCLSQTEIADILGINAATLSARFKEVVGVNMSVYLRTLRIERAKQLLENKVLPLEAVADQTGFGSLKTMYRVFKNETGTTPGQYRMSESS